MTRTRTWIALAVAAVIAVAALTTLLTAPRPGGLMEADSTSPDGARALVTLLRDHGVDVVVADDLDAVVRAARPDTLLVMAQTFFLSGDDTLAALADLPGDRLLVAPTSSTRERLAPAISRDGATPFGGPPGCDLPEATRSGRSDLGMSDTFEAAGDHPSVTRCYDGALVRYTDAGRTVTVVGSNEFMTNAGLLGDGNAALAMNLAGARDRVVWYAPQRTEGTVDGARSITDLIPDQVYWAVLQLCLAVGLIAWWRGRRLGPLVAEDLPVVVRASETVEGRARLYRSRRARDRAAAALRAATLTRLLPRLGLGASATDAAVTQAVSRRGDQDPNSVAHSLFGPAPSSDAELHTLAHQLDDIERQVAQS
ncbi:MAG: DUF4350 domain-containing protein [Mycolicibacterium cosmeticum]|nr:DUF4350 domain-containing protein [Mycolicibacterium cosmeticum]